MFAILTYATPSPPRSRHLPRGGRLNDVDFRFSENHFLLLSFICKVATGELREERKVKREERKEQKEKPPRRLSLICYLVFSFAVLSDDISMRLISSASERRFS